MQLIISIYSRFEERSSTRGFIAKASLIKVLYNLCFWSLCTRLCSRRRQISFTSSTPRALSCACVFPRRSRSCSTMLVRSFIRAHTTNGKPKRALYSALRRVMRETSAAPMRSSPAAPCSSRDSGVRVPLCRSLPARSGWHLRMPSLPAEENTFLVSFGSHPVIQLNRIRVHLAWV